MVFLRSFVYSIDNLSSFFIENQEIVRNSIIIIPGLAIFIISSKIRWRNIMYGFCIQLAFANINIAFFK